jgi:hypothetical protein
MLEADCDLLRAIYEGMAAKLRALNIGRYPLHRVGLIGRNEPAGRIQDSEKTKEQICHESRVFRQMDHPVPPGMAMGESSFWL